MFSQLQTAVKITAVLLILGLCGWIRFQSSEIASLQTENQAQVKSIEQMNQFIEQLNQSIEQLNNQLEQERQAVNEQQQIANELRKRTEQSREKVKVILQKEPCAANALPNAVIDSIKRLHNSNTH